MPILALHGFTGRGSDFAPFAELCGGEWHCPDLPGHGPDPQLDCSPTATLNFIERERSTFNALLGYSMGARAALLHAATYPDAWDALILISPNPGIEDPVERAARRATDAKLAERIEREGVDAFIEFWQQTPMIRSQQSMRPEWRQAMQTARAEHTAVGLAASLRQFGQGSFPDLWPKLHSLKMPICIITGENDAKYTRIAERMSALGLTHTVIDDVGHAPHLEQPEVATSIIRRFLESVERE